MQRTHLKERMHVYHARPGRLNAADPLVTANGMYPMPRMPEDHPRQTKLDEVMRFCRPFLEQAHQKEHDPEDLLNRITAAAMLAAGVKPGVSSGIHGYITRGYGRLDANGFWEFPLADGEFVGD